MPDPDIDFAWIRPYAQPKSRSSAFEEVASILIRDGVVKWPDGTQFLRFGNPDGGREGKGELPNGDIWGKRSQVQAHRPGNPGERSSCSPTHRGALWVWSL